MSSTKALLCDLCVILVVGFTMAADKVNISSSPFDGPKGNCTCAGFPRPQAEPNEPPLIAQSPGLEVKCDEEGENTCKQLCIALATAAKAKGPDVICSRLKNADELKLSAFYKNCDRSWTYANMTAEEPICCHDSESRACPSARLTTKVADEKKEAVPSNIPL